MIRNIKALGLAMVAMLALGAVAAAGASANEFTAEESPAKVHAEQVEESHVFTVEGSEVKCTGAKFDSNEFEAAPSSEVTVHPTYSGCTAFGFVGSTVHTEGCDYVLNAGTTVTAEDYYDGHVDLVCASGKVVKITAGTCEVEVGPQENLTNIRYHKLTGESAGTMEVEAELSEIAVNKTKDGFLCPLKGTGAATGSYVGTTLATGEGEGGPTGIGIE